MFCKEVVLKNLAKSQEDTCVRVSFLIKLQACNFIKEETVSQWKSKTGVNPRVRRLKVRVARLKARVARLKARVARLKARVKAIKLRVR